MRKLYSFLFLLFLCTTAFSQQQTYDVFLHYNMYNKNAGELDMDTFGLGYGRQIKEHLNFVVDLGYGKTEDSYGNGTVRKNFSDLKAMSGLQFITNREGKVIFLSHAGPTIGYTNFEDLEGNLENRKGFNLGFDTGASLQFKMPGMLNIFGQFDFNYGANTKKLSYTSFGGRLGFNLY